MQQTTSQFLRERLLINASGNVLSNIDEVIEVCKLFTQAKCKEQRLNCAMDLELEFKENTAIVTGINTDSILDAKQPEL